MKKYIIIILALFFLTSCWAENNTGVLGTKNNTGTGNVKQNKLLFSWKEAENLIISWEYKKAWDILNEEYKKNNKNTEALRLLNKLKIAEKKYEEAFSYILEANKISNWKDKQLLYDLWIWYSLLWKIDESEKYIKEALKIDPNYRFALEYLKVIEKLKNGIQ